MYLDTFAGVVRDIDCRGFIGYYGGCFLSSENGKIILTGPATEQDGNGGDTVVLPRNWHFTAWKFS